MDPPGTPATFQFAQFGEPRLNNAGKIAFGAQLTGTGTTPTNDSGIWAETNGTLSLVALEGEPAAGFTGDVAYGNMSPLALVGGDGTLAFSGDVRGTGIDFNNYASIWIENQFGTQLIAREGTPAPGTEPGVVFDELRTWFGYDQPTQLGASAWYSLNDRGQLAFLGRLRGTSITGANDAGIWATDVDGSLHLIAREGDTIEIAPGDMRTISFIATREPSGGQDGFARFLNDQGEIAFQANFTDGTSGIVVARIPEPATAVLLLSGGVLAVVIRRRRRAVGH